MSEPMAFVFGSPGEPGYHAVSMDIPEISQDNEREIKEALMRGCIVGRVTKAAAIAGLQEFLRWQEDLAEGKSE